jgi:hypothetical protein
VQKYTYHQLLKYVHAWTALQRVLLLLPGVELQRWALQVPAQCSTRCRSFCTSSSDWFCCNMLKTCRAASGESSSCSTLAIRLDAGLTLRLKTVAGSASSLSLSLYMFDCCNVKGTGAAVAPNQQLFPS